MVEISYFRNMPTLLMIKDNQSRFQMVTEIFANFLGWSSAEECIGKTDYDIPSKASELASDFVTLDRNTTNLKRNTEGKLITLEIFHTSNDWKMLYVERNALKNARGGLCLQAVDVTNSIAFKSYAMLLYRKEQKRPATYILNASQAPILLTEKQECCLFWLIRGKSAKEIAKIMQLSFRTIQDHLAAIKNRLNCTSKSELIEKAIELNYLHYIPKAIQEKI